MLNTIRHALQKRARVRDICRARGISVLPEQDREAILYNIDALLRDAKTRLAYK